MNGATEATLAELVRIAERQNINLERLNSLLSRGGGSGGGSSGGGVSGLLSSIPLLSTGFDLLKGAASMVGSAFEMVGSIIGKLVSGITDTIGNLVKFSLMAMEGTAKLSDLYKAFEDLPFGLGSIAQGFSFLLKTLEKAVGEFTAMANAGATFTGSLTDLRVRAAMVNMTLQEFSKTVQTNSELFAFFGGTVQSGINRFTMAMSAFRPGGQFASTINSLGLTTADASEYMLTMMKIQQGLTQNGKIDSASLSKMTKDYIVQLDGLSKITGIHRDQLNEEAKKIADDQIWMNFLDSIPDEGKRAAMADAALKAMAQGGKNYGDVVKDQLMGGMGIANEAMVKVSLATGGQSVRSAEAIRKIIETIKDPAERSRLLGIEMSKSAIAAEKFSTKLNESGLSNTARDLVDQPLVKFGRSIKAAGGSYEALIALQIKEQDALKNSPAGQLLAAQEKIKEYGNSLSIMMSRLAELLMPTLISWGNKVIDWMGGIANKYGPKLTEWIVIAVDMFDKYVLPKLRKIGDWISETWDQLAATRDKGPTEFFKVLKARFFDGVNNIWEDLQKLWKMIEPTFLKIWNNDIKPVLKKAFEDVGNYIIDILREKVWGAKLFLDPTKNEISAEEKAELRELRKNKNSNKEIMGAGRPEIWNLVGIKRYNDAIDDLNRMISLEKKYRNDPDAANPTPRALGGSVKSGTYLVGERGPELASVGSDGSIITNENLQQLLNRMANNQDNKNLVTLMEALNNNMKQLNGYAKDTAEYTRRTVSEISGLSPNMLPNI